MGDIYIIIWGGKYNKNKDKMDEDILCVLCVCVFIKRCSRKENTRGVYLL